MADSKITDFADGGAIQAADEFAAARSGADFKIAGSKILQRGILAVAQYAPASLATYNVTAAALTALDTTNLTVTFTVPDSGAVVVEFQAVMAGPTGHVLALGLLNHTGGAQLGKTYSTVLSGGAAAAVKTVRWYLTGLTAGASLGIDIAGSVVGGTGKVFAQGATGGANDTAAGPATIVVLTV
jgi:hypothetical protein